MMMKLPKILRPKRSSSGFDSSSPLGSPSSATPSPKISPKISSKKQASPSRSGNLPKSAEISLGSSPRSASSSLSRGNVIKAELEAVFRLFDANGDGRISVSELGAVLKCLAMGNDPPPTEEELLKMVEEVDADGDGFISLDEFLHFHAQSTASVAELKAAFYVFDLDRNGFISADELHRVLVGLGEVNLTMEDCGRMIRGVDSNGDGRVDFEEFKLMMASA